MVQVAALLKGNAVQPGLGPPTRMEGGGRSSTTRARISGIVSSVGAAEHVGNMCMVAILRPGGGGGS